jgi:hypothetical protein
MAGYSTASRMDLRKHYAGKERVACLIRTGYGYEGCLQLLREVECCGAAFRLALFKTASRGGQIQPFCRFLYADRR